MGSGRVGIGAGAAFVVLALLVVGEWGPLIDLDRRAVAPVVELSQDHDTYRDGMIAATWLLNSQLIVAYAVVIAGVLWARSQRRSAIWLVAVVGSGSAVGPLLKQLVDRERPMVAEPVESFSGLSFPSGHAGSAALICAAAAVLAWPVLSRAGRATATVLVVVVPLFSSWTRLTLGGHYLSDVAGGLLFGLAWTALWTPVLRQRRAERACGASGSDG